MRAYGSKLTLITSSRARARAVLTGLARVGLVALVACYGGTRPTSPAPPVPPIVPLRTCADAAAGIERATKDLRDPEVSVVRGLRARCADDAWPVRAVECFASMTAPELGRCAGQLDAEDRERMFAVLAGGLGSRTAVEVVIARLANVRVGIDACDRFVAAVASAMRCEGVPVATRVRLGTDTAEVWSVPASKLSAADRREMADVCTASLAELARTTAAAGCP